MKRKMKIGMSLLIALAFMAPSAVIAGSMNPIEKTQIDAGDSGTISNENNEVMRIPNSPIAQAPGDVNFGGFSFKNPNGDWVEITDEVIIPLADYYTPMLTMFKLDQDCATVKPHMEIYERTDGIEVMMYETSFEDNFDIYNNWIQIDKDCGIIGGQYDSWSWTDARASDGDHSMKSTMYDIYKGNQDDYLECTKEFDVCEQNAVEIYFDVWAEGQNNNDGGDFNPIDFVSFEIGDCTGKWITNLTLDDDGHEYKFTDTGMVLKNYDYDISKNIEDLGGGWWRVYYRANQSALIDLELDCSCLKFRFYWQTDPQRQFEGAYIDNFKVISIEGELEKIYQGHSQGPKEFCREEWTFEFPLDWIPEEKCYRVILWLEVLDPCHQSTFDWPGKAIDFCISDNLDCEITDLTIEDSFTQKIVEDGGIMEAGADAHIMYTYHQNGTICSEDIPITATAYKLSWDTVFESDCEGLPPFPDMYGNVGKSTDDAHSGSASLAFMDQDVMEYHIDEFAYALGPTIDFGTAKEVYMDYYWKGNTDPGDSVYPCLVGVVNNYVLGSSAAQMGGLQLEWTGPSENVADYTRVNLKDLYEKFLASGFFQDEDGVYTKVPVGFYFSTDGDDSNSHPDAIGQGVYWSGVYIDDITITVKDRNGEVWTDSMVIPGPLCPCESETHQFEWEDIPYSNYEICVKAECEGDIDPDDNEKCQEILVVDDLERATLKNIETIDYTDLGNCEWGICTSDYDNYLSTNPTTELYGSECNAVAQLKPFYDLDCEDDELCFDITGLDIHDPAPITTQYINEGFDTVFPVSWIQTGAEWFRHAGNEAGGVAAGQADCNSGSITGTASDVRTPTFDASGDDTVELSFTWAANHGGTPGPFIFRIYAYDTAIPGWSIILDESITASVPITAESIPLTTTTNQLSFEVIGADAGEFGYVVFDDVLVEGIEYFTAPDTLSLEFDAWWELQEDKDYVYLELANACPAEYNSDWVELKNWTNNSFAIGDDDGWYHEVVDLEPFVTGNYFELRFRFYSDDDTELRGMIIDNVIINNYLFPGYPTDNSLYGLPDPMNNLENWCLTNQQIGDYWNGAACCESDDLIGMCIPDEEINNAFIWDTEINDAYEAYLIVNHSYEFSNQIPVFEDDFQVLYSTSGNFTDKTYGGSQTWQTQQDWWGPTATPYPMVAWWITTTPFNASLVTDTMDLTSIPAGLPATIRTYWSAASYTYMPGGEFKVWAISNDSTTGVEDGRILVFDAAAEEGGDNAFSGGWQDWTFDPYDLGSPGNATIEMNLYWPTDDQANFIRLGYFSVLGTTEPCTGYIELSADGGENWVKLDELIGFTDDKYIENVYDISYWAGNDILVRFRVEGNTDSVDDRFWCIKDLRIAGKKDDTAPTSTITMSGTMSDAGWYNTPVQVAITATDDNAVKEIHYILDGSETVVSGDSASFTVSGNGAHNIEFWAIDIMGNEELPHNTVPTFRIDSGSPPTVAITAPEPGLYLFGNKLLSSSKVFIIGAFNIEATASDAESGVYRVQFYLDGDLISEDTEVPYSAYCAVKHMGAGTIKAVAEDFSGNTAEDTLDITYYKFL